MTHEEFVKLFAAVAWGCITLFIYFLPFIVALACHNKRSLGVFVLNFFAGWTGLGWLGSFVWAVADQSEKVKP